MVVVPSLTSVSYNTNERETRETDVVVPSLTSVSYN